MTDVNTRAPKRKVSAHKYERRGTPLLIDPKAYLETFFLYDDTARENLEVGEAVVVDIRDALEQHEHPWFDSYESILARVGQACATSARAVILRFDSPGGEAAGCFESALEVRRLCDAAGKELHAYVEGDCCSAAYAFAAVCQSITVGDTSLTGSIGVVLSRDDWSAANAAQGIRVAFITSGARKADGHPDNPITDAELAALQAVIDELAQVFFNFVYSTRGLAVQTVQQLEARYLAAQSAVASGLADEVGTLSTVLAKIAGGVKGSTMPNPYEKARAALEEAAKGEDANAKAAQAALAALDAASGGGTDEEKPPADPPPADDPEKRDDPKTGDPAPTRKPDDDREKAAASAYRAAIAAQREAAAARAELRAMREDAERAELLASRPGMAPEMHALLKRAPIELVRETIGDMPATPVNPQLSTPPRRGADQSTLGLSTEEKQRLDERMGLKPRTPGDQSNDHKLVLGGRRPVATKPSPTTN